MRTGLPQTHNTSSRSCDSTVPTPTAESAVTELTARELKNQNATEEQLAEHAALTALPVAEAYITLLNAANN